MKPGLLILLGTLAWPWSATSAGQAKAERENGPVVALADDPTKLGPVTRHQQQKFEIHLPADWQIETRSLLQASLYALGPQVENFRVNMNLYLEHDDEPLEKFHQKGLEAIRSQRKDYQLESQAAVQIGGRPAIRTVASVTTSRPGRDAAGRPTTVRLKTIQLQYVIDLGRRKCVITCTAPAGRWNAFRKLFDASVATFKSTE